MHDNVSDISIPQRKPNLVFIVMAGLFVSGIFTMEVMFGLQKGWGVNPGVITPITFLVTMISAFVGSAYAGFYYRKRGVLVGLLIALTFLVLFLGLLVALPLAFVILSKPENMRPELISRMLEVFATHRELWLFLATVFVPIPFGAMGGYFGQKYSNYKSDTMPIIQFYLRYDWKLIFSAYFIFEIVRIGITHSYQYFYIFLWLTIGNIFILIHPTLWFQADLIFEGFSFLAFTSALLLLFSPAWAYSVFRSTKKRSIIIRCLMVVGIYLVAIIGSTIAVNISKAPIENMVDRFTKSGGGVWPMLLSRVTFPL